MSPSCPVDYVTKDWVEDSLHFLGSVFGRDHLATVRVVEPTEEFFPEPYQANLKSATRLLQTTAQFLGTQTDGIGLKLVKQRDEIWLAEDADFEQPLVTTKPPAEEITFAVEKSDLQSPDVLVGMFSRELCGLRLVEDVGVNTDSHDFGPLADLTATFLGLGLFTAALPYFEIEASPSGGRQMPVTLPPISAGYALAHIAWHQDLAKPGWFKYLQPRVAACAKQGLRYLIATGESDFAPTR